MRRRTLKPFKFKTMITLKMRILIFLLAVVFGADVIRAGLYTQTFSGINVAITAC